LPTQRTAKQLARCPETKHIIYRGDTETHMPRRGVWLGEEEKKMLEELAEIYGSGNAAVRAAIRHLYHLEFNSVTKKHLDQLLNEIKEDIKKAVEKALREAFEELRRQGYLQ